VQAGGTSLSFFAIQTGCLIWALPCQVFLLIWLWTNKRVGGTQCLWAGLTIMPMVCA